MNPLPIRRVVLLIGSNIDPITNIRFAVEEIKSNFPLNQFSSVWETKPIGTTGGNFLNLAVAISTDLPYDSLKLGLRTIESKCGRVRTADKNAPRTMDIDIILDGDIIREQNLWNCVYVAVPVAEIIPDLINPESQKLLINIAEELIKTSWIIKYPAGINN